MMETVVVALGGNALLKKGEKPTFQVQYKNVKAAAKGMASMIAKDMSIVITHGNGPQVGDELLRGHYARSVVPQLPLYLLGAETQAFIGSMLERALTNELAAAHINRKVCTVITHALVEKKDPAFRHPSKPIGPYYSKKELAEALKEQRFPYVEEEGKYRRVVGSPEPKKILEIDSIRKLVDQGIVVICCGGGGIPVFRQGASYVGAYAVIDKDSTSGLLASSIGAKKLYIFTKTKYVYSDFGHLRGPIRKMRAAEVARSLNTYEEGTWRPKMAAAARFIMNGGKEARIGMLEDIEGVISGRTGTTIS